MNGALVDLRLVGTPVGALCSSESVNRGFVGRLSTLDKIQQEGGIEEARRKLGFEDTEQGIAAFEAMASREFEPLKVSSQWGLHSTVTLSGSMDYSIVLFIDEEQMRSFFDPIVEEIIGLIEAQTMPDDTKVIIIPGGFGNSQYLYERLQERFDPKDISFDGTRIEIFDELRMAGYEYQPILTGALLRYDSITARSIPAQYSFGFGQVEIFDSKLHPDGLHAPGDTLENGRICTKPVWKVSVVKRDPFEEIGVVENRWFSLLTKVSRPSI